MENVSGIIFPVSGDLILMFAGLPIASPCPQMTGISEDFRTMSPKVVPEIVKKLHSENKI